MRYSKTSLGVAVILCLATAPGIAQEAGRVNVDPAATVEVGAVGRIAAAMTLSKFGQESREPVIILGAAAAINRVGVSEQPLAAIARRPIEGAQLSQDAQPSADPLVVAKPDLVADLLKQARLLSKGDSSVLEIAAKIADGAARGPVGGARQHQEVIAPRTMVEFGEEFHGAETAEVLVIGEPGAPVSIQVLDEGGTVVCKAASVSEERLCSWVVVWSGPFFLRISNEGLQPAHVLVLLN